MNKNHELRQELESLAPTLQRLKQAEPTPPPPGYFDGLPDEVLRCIRAEEASGLLRREGPATKQASRPWLGWLWGWLWRPAWALAMVAVLAVALLQWWHPNEEAAAGPLAGLSAEELGAYVEGRIDEFGEELLLEVAPEEELSLSLPLDDEALDEVGEELLDDLSMDELKQML